MKINADKVISVIVLAILFIAIIVSFPKSYNMQACETFARIAEENPLSHYDDETKEQCKAIGVEIIEK